MLRMSGWSKRWCQRDNRMWQLWGNRTRSMLRRLGLGQPGQHRLAIPHCPLVLRGLQGGSHEPRLRVVPQFWGHIQRDRCGQMGASGVCPVCAGGGFWGGGPVVECYSIWDALQQMGRQGLRVVSGRSLCQNWCLYRVWCWDVPDLFSCHLVSTKLAWDLKVVPNFAFKKIQSSINNCRGHWISSQMVIFEKKIRRSGR